MEQLQEQNKKIQEYRRKVLEKTCTVRELAEAWGISYTKALRLTRVEGFPVLSIGRDKRVIISKLDEFLNEHMGENLL